jgi:hypothetical protein
VALSESNPRMGSDERCGGLPFPAARLVGESREQRIPNFLKSRDLGLSARHHTFARNNPHGPQVLGMTGAGFPAISQRRSLAPRLEPPKARGFFVNRSRGTIDAASY